MIELVDQIRAALDRAEGIARAATPDVSSHPPHGFYDMDGMCDTAIAFIDANMPDRALRAIAAHREILAMYEEIRDRIRALPPGTFATEGQASKSLTLGGVIMKLASIYLPEGEGTE